MSDSYEILAICGSLRQKSYNLAALRACGELMPEGMKLRITSLADVPMYNADVQEKGWPEPVARLKDEIAKADAVLIASPEYNYTVSGVLKNAIDWISRYKDNPLKWKPAAILSVTGGPLGGARGQHDLRKILIGFGTVTMPPPDVFIGAGQTKFDAEGRLTDEPTRKFLADHMKSFQDWIARMKRAAA